MRRIANLTILVIALLGISSYEATAQKFEISGRTIDANSEPVAYATVVALRGTEQAAGCVTNDDGEFKLSVAADDYTLKVIFIGYRTIEREISLCETTSLGDIILEEDKTAIDEVVVTAQLIRREADRFVVDVANSPIAIGKDGEELLKSSPGVWIQDNEISVNGASGTKVYLNDREVKMEDEQLINYLRSLRADDIQRIEVIPQSGADYDAASSGGIIKITTKKRLDSGLIGTASLSATGTKGMYNLGPSVSLNYNRGKVNAYGRLWGGINGHQYNSTEHTNYTSATMIDAATAMDEKSHYAGGNFGIVYDITDKHSIGGELQYNYWGGGGNTDTWTEHTLGNTTTRSDGIYDNSYHNQHITATLNYIYKLDDKGSTLKLIGDYTNSQSPNSNNYFDTTYDLATPLLKRDSTYRQTSMSHYQLATATLALEKVLTPKVTLKAGAKYTYNNNDNSADYEYFANNIWNLNNERSYNIAYTENIGALYATASARLGRVSLVGGLRGEYTSFRSADGAVKQDYFDLFPNANVSWSMTADGSYSLIAQYARTISRPNFWALSPNETKISEYMIQRGNPDLKAAYDNSISITAVLKYKYSITLGMSIKQNAIQQTTLADSDNPELLILQHINYPTINSYFASSNLQFQFTKWWSSNVNFTGIYLGQRIYPEEPMRHNFMCFANAQTSFSLPRNYFIELSGNYMHGIVAGNTSMSDMGNLSVTFKKRLLDNKLTLSLGLQNLIPVKAKVTIEEEAFQRVMTVDQPWQRPAIKFSISYNFNSGKQFRAKSVESGSAEDRDRIGNSNSSGQ